MSIIPNKPKDVVVLGVNGPMIPKNKAKLHTVWKTAKHRIDQLSNDFPDQVKPALLCAEVSFRLNPKSDYLMPAVVVDHGNIVVKMPGKYNGRPVLDFIW